MLFVKNGVFSFTIADSCETKLLCIFKLVLFKTSTLPFRLIFVKTLSQSNILFARLWWHINFFKNQTKLRLKPKDWSLKQNSKLKSSFKSKLKKDQVRSLIRNEII